MTSPEKPAPTFRRHALARLVPRLIHLSARFTRPLTLGVRAVILDEAGHVFLVRHSYVPGWHLPGGAVEPGETVVEALVREVREECNIEVSGTPAFHGIFFNSRASRRDHVLVYQVRDFRVIGRRDSDWEIIEAGFFDVDALPEGTSAATRARLREIIEHRPVAAIW